jgi:hypothetical protein
MASGLVAASDLEQFTSEGGTASIKKKRASAPRDANYVVVSGLVAASDLGQFTSEGGTASIKKKRASAPRDANYVVPF